MLTDEPKKSGRGDYDRRWISDEYFDLIVWYDRKDAVHGFQLCYGKPQWERALTWITDRGFSHAEVQTGEERPDANRTPILVADGSFPVDEVRREFQRRAVGLPGDLRDLILAKIAEFETRRKT
ncbi:MAG TPA: hypothetical protein VNW72_14635 [Chthoniobacterales bacterium]|nr:hypothetical protein [Chthoniobacterales bacterium]